MSNPISIDSSAAASEQAATLLINIPCLNEEATVADVISAIPSSIPGIGTIEIMVLDDGSTDRTVERATEANATVVSNPENLGLGPGIQPSIPGIPHHSYDFDPVPLLLRASEMEPAPDGLLGPEEAPGRSLVHHGHLHASHAVPFGQGPSGQKGDAHGLEIPRADQGQVGLGEGPSLGVGLAFHRELAVEEHRRRELVDDADQCLSWAARSSALVPH